MKNISGGLFSALSVLLFCVSCVYANTEIQSRIQEVKTLEEQGDFYQLALEKERMLTVINEADLLNLPDDDILWLLNYGNDASEYMFFSLTGKASEKGKVYDKKLRLFVEEYSSLWDSISNSYKTLSGKEIANSGQFSDILKGGFSSASFFPGLYLVNGAWEMLKKYFAKKEEIDYFIAELKIIKNKYNTLLENTPNSAWSFVLLSYAKFKRQNTEYLKKLNDFESFLRRSTLSYKRLKTLENGILDTKQCAISYDTKIRGIVFDLPIFTIQAYTDALIESSKGIFDDDEEVMMEAGLFFSKTSNLINMAVDDSVRTGWTNIAKRLKEELCKNQYEELKTKAQMINAIWDFDDVQKAITWP